MMHEIIDQEDWINPDIAFKDEEEQKRNDGLLINDN